MILQAYRITNDLSWIKYFRKIYPRRLETFLTAWRPEAAAMPRILVVTPLYGLHIAADVSESQLSA